MLLVGGFRDGEGYLGYTDLYGTHFADNYLATGLGMYMALPLMRNQWSPEMSEAEARTLLETALKICYYRDTRASNKARASAAAPHACIEHTRTLRLSCARQVGSACPGYPCAHSSSLADPCFLSSAARPLSLLCTMRAAQIQIARVDATGVHIEEPITLVGEWNHAAFIAGSAKAGDGGW